MSRRRGIAMAMVLFVIFVLTAVVVELQYNASINARITMNTRDKLKATYLARSGYYLSQLRLQADAQIDRFLGAGNIDHLDESIWALPLMLPMPKEILEAEVEKGNLTRRMADEFVAMQEFGGQIVATIEDESAKINLNDLRHYQGKTTNYTFKLLEALLYQEEFNEHFERLDRIAFIDNLIDWIDEDNSMVSFGGNLEDVYYSQQKPQYGAKNMPFFSVAEARLVKDVDAQLFKKLEPYVTVFPYNVRLQTQENGKINVNTAPRQILAALFSPDFQLPEKNLELADMIIEYRQKYGAFKNGRDFADRIEKDLGIPPTALDLRSASQKLTGSSDVFRIISNGISNNVTATIEAVITRNRTQGSFITYYYQLR